ncbi:SelB C-terminal domain-containing protein [Planococcus sp. 107-1]|uniref:SelB domain-containing protein n=1 Tax=Planococcus sp. 107-1 TaxID=2908840 RepID=UPI002882D814|nr:SelB C-terminal domain-containing protein [Planococcus sp. 107-1]
MKKADQFIALGSFMPHLPKQWKTRMEQMIAALQKDGLQAEKWDSYSAGSPVPKQELLDLTFYLLQTGKAYRLTEEVLIHHSALDYSIAKLKEATGGAFNLKQAKDVLGVSRKYLIPFLELLDELKITVRTDEQRKWTES